MPVLFCRRKSSPHTEPNFAPQPSVSEANTYQSIDETGKSAKRTTNNGAVAACTKEEVDNVCDNAVDNTKHMYEVVNKFVDDLAKKPTTSETVTVENDDDEEEEEIRKHTADDIIMHENDDIYVRRK